MSGSASLNAERRAAELGELRDGEVVDVLVIGGGVTGAGVALDAASRGLSVALVERRDLAHGTSRWSSKLVHGGVRYLASGDVGLAFESARERRVLMEHTAPHLVRALPMLIPFTDHLSRSRAELMALSGYAGNVLRVASGTSSATLPRPRRTKGVEALRLVPGLRASGLRGSMLFWDGQLEDDARLVVTLARTAASLGAKVITYCAALAVDGSGATVRDERTGESFDLRARHVVNATGVWADTLEPSARLRPSKGAHLVIPAERLGHPRAAVAVPVPGARNRYVFALPQPDGHVFVGLTDDPLDGPVPDVPEVDDRDEAFLLETINRVLATPITPAEVVGRFAGLRPLLAGTDGATADLSRHHRIIEGPDGVLTVVGGKLTTYRRMAEDVVDRVAARRGVAAGRCTTKRLRLIGARSPSELASLSAPARLRRRYGAEAPLVAALAADDPGLLEPIAPGVATLGVELRFGVEHEGALTASDLVDRRTRIGLVDTDRALALAVAEQVVEDIGDRAALPRERVAG